MYVELSYLAAWCQWGKLIVIRSKGHIPLKCPAQNSRIAESSTAKRAGRVDKEGDLPLGVYWVSRSEKVGGK